MYQCSKCHQCFASLQRLESHLKRKIPCQGQVQLKLNSDLIQCKYCDKTFARQDNLVRHEKKFCQKKEHIQTTDDHSKIINTKLEKQIAELKEQSEKQIEELKKQFDELKNKPTNVNNQVLQVICVSNNDNYLDILTKEWGSFDLALEYIKDCALSSMTGDCKLIDKIYLSQSGSVSPAIRFLDKGKTKIEYFNEKKEKVIDSKEMFGKKIANNLQNSYLKGVNHLLNQNLENRRCPNKFLEDYDLQTWNQHIYDLSNVQYQKKIINNLSIT